MNREIYNPHEANEQSNRSVLAGQTSQQIVGGGAPFAGLDLQNIRNITWNPQIPYTQYYPSISLPSLEAPIFGQQLQPPTVKTPPIKVPPETSAVLNATDSYQPEKQPKYQGFFALLTTTERLIKYGERIFDHVDQHFSIYARVTADPRQNTNDTHFILDNIGQEQKLSGDLYLAFGFMKGHLHVDFSSAVCKTFFLKRYRAPARGSAFQEECVYRIRQFGLGVNGLLRSQAAGILTSSFEEKARAAYWRNFQRFPLSCSGNDRVAMGLAVGGPTAGPSNSGFTRSLCPAVVDAIQHGQQGREDPRSQFSEPPPVAHQPHSQSSFLEEATSVAQYPPSTLSHGPLPHESTSYWAYRDGQRTALGNNVSAFTMQGGLAAPMPVYPTSTSVPWYRDCVSKFNSQGPGTGVSIPGPDHRTTSDYTNYGISYHHAPATQIPFPDHNVRTPGLSLNYPPGSADQADASQVTVSSNAGVPAESSGQRLIQIRLEPAPIPSPTPKFVPPAPSVPTPAPPAPVKTKKRGRPRKNKGKEPQRPHSNSYPPSTSPEQVPDPQKTRNISAHESRPSTTPVYNNVVATPAQTSNSTPPRMFFPQPLSGFHYPPSYNAYQPVLVPPPFSFTYASQAASYSLNFGVPALPPHQTQQSNSDGLPRADDMNRPWWNRNSSGEEFQ